MNQPILKQSSSEDVKRINYLPYVHDKYTERANDFGTFLHPIGKSLFNARSLS